MNQVQNGAIHLSGLSGGAGGAGSGGGGGLERCAGRPIRRAGDCSFLAQISRSFAREAAMVCIANSGPRPGESVS